MEGTFEFKLKNGSICTIKAKYECMMENEILDADGVKVVGRSKPTIADCSLVAYVDGREFDSSWNPSSWALIDTRQGVKKIWGLKIGFADPAEAKRYEEWISGIIEAGKSEEVKEYEKANKEKELKEQVENAKRIIEKAKSQSDIPTMEEARRRTKQYNDAMNEGGEGYVPHIISIDEYERAKNIIKRYEEDNDGSKDL